MIYTVEIPDQLASAFESQCARHGINPSRLVAALLLTQASRMSATAANAGALKHLEAWERGKRRVGKWNPTAEVKPVETIGIDHQPGVN